MNKRSVDRIVLAIGLTTLCVLAFVYIAFTQILSVDLPGFNS